MILIIDLCKHKLHSNEFVKPICRIIKDMGYKFNLINIRETNYHPIKKYRGIIICGTALKDNWYTNNYKRFDFIKRCEIKILGISAGMQIISLVFGSKLIRKCEIGAVNVNIIRDDKVLGVSKGKILAYLLHNFSVVPSHHFIEIGVSKKCTQIIKHKQRDIYGVMFHPEVFNKNIIENFVRSCFKVS